MGDESNAEKIKAQNWASNKDFTFTVILFRVASFVLSIDYRLVTASVNRSVNTLS